MKQLKSVIKVAELEEQLFEVHGFKYLMESIQLSLADQVEILTGLSPLY